MRTLAAPGEAISINVMILTPGGEEQTPGRRRLYCIGAVLGNGDFATAPLEHVARRVLPCGNAGRAGRGSRVRILLEADIAGSRLVWPATAPVLNQTVVISDVAKSGL